jgi:hypothetical protein
MFRKARNRSGADSGSFSGRTSGEQKEPLPGSGQRLLVSAAVNIYFTFKKMIAKV